MKLSLDECIDYVMVDRVRKFNNYEDYSQSSLYLSNSKHIINY